MCDTEFAELQAQVETRWIDQRTVVCLGETPVLKSDFFDKIIEKAGGLGGGEVPTQLTEDVSVTVVGGGVEESFEENVGGGVENGDGAANSMGLGNIVVTTGNYNGDESESNGETANSVENDSGSDSGSDTSNIVNDSGGDDNETDSSSNFDHSHKLVYTILMLLFINM